MPTSHSRRSLRVLLALSVVLAVVLSGCYQDPNPTDYGDAAKANFIEGCTEDVDAKGGTTTVVTIQTKSVCECIYELIESPGEGAGSCFRFTLPDAVRAAAPREVS